MRRLIRAVIGYSVRVQRFSDRLWYLPVVSLLAAADLFIFVVPTDALVISSVLLKPSRWVWSAVMISAGSALGAALLAFFIQGGHGVVFEWLLPSLTGYSVEGELAQWISKYGILALALGALSPFPLSPVVVVGALTGMPITEVGLGVFLGRLPKYGLYAWLSWLAPQAVLRIPFLKQELETMSVTDEGTRLSDKDPL